MKQGRRAQKFIFASLMDVCHLKNESTKSTKVELYSEVIL